ncbi:TolC family outer membrane protein [uncultured Ferrovibrio sp.]|jgi:type I secretion outer membrane protein, TolC family|uniref:TolC family outer membrane protein n=1 Tax=uncultured Ferrovibrio sp. TaxID=1576913 RepID=UPI00260B84FF|nr:TolC family outer membrane protein [uncultured Ferrovibrio sp.]
MSFKKALLASAMAGICALAVQPAVAQSLSDVLSAAYNNNPTLLAARASLRATDEGVPQALSNWRPTISVTGETGILRQEFDPQSASFQNDTINPRSLSLNLAQPLYRGGRTEAATEAAEALVLAGRQDLASTERRILLDAVTAYMDVVQNQAVLDLNRNNEEVLRRQLEATRERFRVGEITRTDVAQAESRLSGAVAGRISAEGALVSARAVLARVIGEMPGTLTPPPPLPELPRSEEEAVAIAYEENPDLLGARFREVAAKHDVRAISGALLPSLSLNGSLSRADETSRANLETDSARVSLQLTVPLYESGSVYSQTRQRKQIHNQRRIQVEEQRRAVRQSVVQAWENLTTARSNIEARRAQVEAARIALEGVQQEAEVGSRTTLDVLDAEQEYLDARVAEVRARRDEYVAGFTLLSAIGRLGARQLALPVEYYDPIENYDRVRNKWFGTDGGLTAD